MNQVCENCGGEVFEGQMYVAARRYETGLNDPFVLIHVECPKDHRDKVELLLANGANSVLAHAIMALIEKLDELPIIGLTSVEVSDGDN